ncbi:MAG: GerMN domain-containing protein [Patescibacteria group bacterium]|nr:GerMN domain-containing protein [Patescibacteria group bacterium]
MKRALFGILGILFVILGLLGLVLPFLQGILFIAVGLILLSYISPEIRGTLRKYTSRIKRLDIMVERLEKRFAERENLALIGALLLLAIIAIPTVFFFLRHKTPAVLETEATIPIVLYFYDPAQDQGPGGSQCGRNGLVAVNRVLPQTQTPLRDTIALLLRGEITAEERARGLTTELPLPGVALADAEIQDGAATLTFTDPQNRTSGGSCRAALLWREIEATAKQFPSVQSVRFLPEYLFQP